MADTKIVIFNADSQSASIDYRTEATNLEGRQVVVIGDPSVNAAVAEVASLDVGSSSTAYGQVVRLAGSAQINIVAAGTGVTLGVNLGKVDGTIQVDVGKINDSVKVVNISGGTLAVNVGTVADVVSVKFVSVAGTAGVNIGKIDGTIQTVVGRIDDVVSVRMNSIAGTVGVNLGKVDGTIQVNVGKIDDLVAIKTTSASGTLGVHLLTTAGTITVKVGPESAVLVNAFHTANIFTVAGSTSGVSASGVTLVSPSANANFKIFAYNLQTTGISSSNVQFTNGAGTSPTVFWVPLITAVETTSTPKGANLAITPPGFLFATGVSTTLALLNQGSLVHYSISYIKESA